MSDRLKRALQLNKMSQGALARRVGIDHSMISYYCSGQRVPRLSTASRIAAALDTTIDHLWPPEVMAQKLEARSEDPASSREKMST